VRPEPVCDGGFCRQNLGRASIAGPVIPQRSPGHLAADRGIEAIVIGTAAMATHHYVRHTEDIDLGVNVAVCDLPKVSNNLRLAGFEVAYPEPDGQDPLGGVIDISGAFGLVQIVNFRE